MSPLLMLQEIAPSFQDLLIAWVFNNAALLAGAAVVWWRFGRNAEKVFASLGKIGELGNIVQNLSGAIADIKSLLVKHEVRLDAHDKEIDRVEHQVHARITRLEDRP